MLDKEERGTRGHEEGRGGRRDEEEGGTRRVKKLVNKKKDEKVARGHIVDHLGLVIGLLHNLCHKLPSVLAAKFVERIEKKTKGNGALI